MGGVFSSRKDVPNSSLELARSNDSGDSSLTNRDITQSRPSHSGEPSFQLAESAAHCGQPLQRHRARLSEEISNHGGSPSLNVDEDRPSVCSAEENESTAISSKDESRTATCQSAFKQSQSSNQGVVMASSSAASIAQSTCHNPRGYLTAFHQGPQLRDLVTELRKVIKKWHQLGLLLNIPPDRLDKIEDEYSSPDRRLSEILLYWLNNEESPSWEKICDALRRLGGFTRLVRELTIKYCSLNTLRSMTTCRRQHCKLLATRLYIMHNCF